MRLPSDEAHLFRFPNRTYQKQDAIATILRCELYYVLRVCLPVDNYENNYGLLTGIGNDKTQHIVDVSLN